MATISSSTQAVIQQRLFGFFNAEGKINFQSVGGGSINETYRVQLSEMTVFCKINSATKFPQLFRKEAAGLKLIAEQAVIKTPVIIDCFENANEQVLLLEWVREGERTDTFWKALGKQLAALHCSTTAAFGLDEDNYMGSVPQQNKPCANWIDFFIRQRLEPIIKRCINKNLLTNLHLNQAEKLYQRLPIIFEEDEPPSLVHGDLWSGNFMCNSNSEPVLIDPAVYYGHRSVDLAMTTLFGGFHQSFYEAYNYHFPFQINYKEQWEVCNLYPLLIHLYLFGASYLTRIEQTLNKFA